MSERKKTTPQPAPSSRESKANIFEPRGDLLKRIQASVSRGEVKYYTPYTLAQELNIRISTARKILREAARKGILKLYSGGRRAPVYIPAQHSSSK
ncbi:MAG: 30S ribosomal protein S25e [Desulfurococcus sp.]|nr:30S ribosomal protein S25e [Desulfurococcus sp.]